MHLGFTVALTIHVQNYLEIIHLENNGKSELQRFPTSYLHHKKKTENKIDYFFELTIGIFLNQQTTTNEF